MFGAVREYKVQPGKADEVAEKVRAEFLPMIEKAPGFVGYSLAAVGPDGVVTTSTFETRQQAEDSVKMASDWVNENLASLMTGPPRVTTGEIVVRHVVEGVNPTHGALRRFEGNPAKEAQNLQRIRESLLPLLSASPGFASYLVLIEDGRARGLTLSAFADQTSAEATGERAMAWVNDNIEDVELTEVVTGEIKIRHMRATAATH